MVQRTIDQGVEMTVGNTPGKRIRWARIQKGWLIKTLAAKANITPEYLSLNSQYGWDALKIMPEDTFLKD